MSQDKPTKVLRMLRAKAQEFLSSRKHSENLVNIFRHFESGADTNACLLTLDFVFTNVLKQGEMVVDVVPLKPVQLTPENQYKEWLRDIYDKCWEKILSCCENPSNKLQIQALSTCINLLSHEGKYPLEQKNADCYVPLNRLKSILMKVLSNKQTNAHLVNKFEEYLCFDDIQYFTWKALPNLTAKCNPNEIYITNYLLLLEKLNVKQNNEGKVLCSTLESNNTYNYDESVTRRCLNKIWNCIMHWEHSPATHKQLLIVLLEKALPYLDKPIVLTDFLMDSLDVGGPVSLLALQGIFTLIQTYNLDYPNIFAKLYSMFEPEIFHTKFKARLFYLSDLFLRSTHLPENLVAAFAKRLARLALVAPSEDIIIICMFIGNLILRHPGLKCLLDHQSGVTTNTDPYIMEERDPVKSNAINSSLWEIQTLQYHALPNVASAAKFINNPLPSVEWDLGKMLDRTDNVFDREIKKNSELIALAFNVPNSFSCTKTDKISEYWSF